MRWMMCASTSLIIATNPITAYLLSTCLIIVDRVDVKHDAFRGRHFRVSVWGQRCSRYENIGIDLQPDLCKDVDQE